MSKFNHQRHKPLTPLDRERTLILAFPQLRSNVNLSRIVRAASCFAVTKIVTCGNTKVDSKIARNGLDQICIESRRSLGPPLKKLKLEGYQLVGLEQTDSSSNIHEFQFARETVLVVGHERNGIPESVLTLLDAAVEIPVYGLPFSLNVATATSIAMCEYCRRFPQG